MVFTEKTDKNGEKTEPFEVEPRNLLTKGTMPLHYIHEFFRFSF
nr:MAG TPA: hypothetical protein [Caudoviricetes sp.]